MNLNLSLKMIRDRCGDHSFTRGETFYEKNKIEWQSDGPDSWKAVVKGTEDFYVTIRQISEKDFVTSCTCPKLASVEQDCHHIAGALIALYHKERLTDDFLTLFHNKKKLRSIGAQSHFENRDILALDVICRVLRLSGRQTVLGIEMRVDGRTITDMYAFLSAIKNGISYTIGSDLTYNRDTHYFHHEVAPLIQELTNTFEDESSKMDAEDASVLILPPSSGERLWPFFLNSPFISLVNEGRTYSELKRHEGQLPLTFHLRRTVAGNFLLTVHGLEEVLILHDYRLIFFNGMIKPIEVQDGELLGNMQHVLSISGKEHIRISEHQTGFLKERVLPILRRIGRVTGMEKIASAYRKPSLKAKLYLDRIRNRLLAGLEFHYGDLVINPFEEKTSPEALLIERDFKKEKDILDLM